MFHEYRNKSFESGVWDVCEAKYLIKITPNKIYRDKQKDKDNKNLFVMHEARLLYLFFSLTITALEIFV